MDETRRQRLDALKFTWKVRGAGVAVDVAVYAVDDAVMMLLLMLTARSRRRCSMSFQIRN
jgi:hypothetical protein